MKIKKTRCGEGSGIRDGAYSSGMGKADDEAAFKAALVRLRHRTQDSMESQDGWVNVCSFRGDDHERRTTLEAGNSFHSQHPLLSPTASPYLLRSAVPTNANIDRC